MMSAGTPCPFDGKIGTQAKKSWVENPAEAPEGTKLRRDARKKAEAIEAAKAAKEAAEEPTNEYPG